MGAPKKKWSQEEEDALTAGIARYGAGKWSAILNDPDYQTVLSARTNVDLKDKYRNIKAMEKGVGHRQRGMGVPKVKSAPKNQAAATSKAIVKYVAKPAKPSKLQPKKNSVASTSGPALVVKPPEDLKNKKQIDPQSADMEIVQVDSPKGGNKHALVKFEVDDELHPPVEVVKYATVKHEIDYIQKKLVDMTAEEADVAAAVAVAEAEAAREWAERAGREADAVEREAEAARNFADSMSSVDYMEFFLIKY